MLAHGLVCALDAQEHPGALAEALIFTPNHRAARELALALHRAISADTGAALIAPDIRALGDLEDDDTLAAFSPDALSLPPVLPPARRRGTLARLIQAWRTRQDERPLPPASALAAADELAGLLDQAALSGGVDWSKLEQEALPPGLSEHWRKSASFLGIVAEAWPQHLAELGMTDSQERRRMAAEALAARWTANPPQHPVIIAGSTGSGAATRVLMRAALRLPRGMVILPGLDHDIESPTRLAIERAPSHPQHTLSDTLKALGVHPEQVAMWPDADETSGAIARRRLLNEALAPAEATKDWSRRLNELAMPDTREVFVRRALTGLRLVEAEDEGEEALAIALLLRETLETPGATAALVTPEANIGRRVAAILERWGVDVAPSSGVPLSRTAAGGLLLQIMRWARDPADPVLLLALLKHGLVTRLGDPEILARRTSVIERETLRGPRLSRDLSHLAARLEAVKRGDKILRFDPEAKLIRDLAAIHAAHAHAFSGPAIDGGAAARACAAIAEALGGPRIWSGAAGAMAARFLETLADICAEMGEAAAWSFADFAESIASAMITPPDAPEHPRIAIWGPLEARLQRRDRIILAGLNEGAWPRAAAADAFLNREMRKRLGLPDPDERIGLSAHDFAQLANAPEVIITRARRVDDKPAVASRWIWRLRTLAAGGLGGREAADALLSGGDACLAWAKDLRKAGALSSAKAPQPRPPADKRNLTGFSPTRAANLIRDPYSDYARYVLELQVLRRAGEEIDARERGTAVHAAVERHSANPAANALGDLVKQALIEAGASPEFIAIEGPLWLRAARICEDWLARRKPFIDTFDVEKKAEISFRAGELDITLKATADRVERLADGTLAIIDFKTGRPKTAKQVFIGLEPQLPLEAAIAAQAAFGKVAPGPASQLVYFQFSTSAAVLKDDNGEPLDLKNEDKEPVAAHIVVEKTLDGLKRLIASYNDARQPYLSRPRVFSVHTVSDYDRLARRGEWTLAEGEE